MGGIIQRNLLTVGRWKRTSEAVQRPGVVAKNLYRRGAKSWVRTCSIRPAGKEQKEYIFFFFFLRDTSVSYFSCSPLTQRGFIVFVLEG